MDKVRPPIYYNVTQITILTRKKEIHVRYIEEGKEKTVKYGNLMNLEIVGVVAKVRYAECTVFMLFENPEDIVVMVIKKNGKITAQITSKTYSRLIGV